MINSTKAYIIVIIVTIACCGILMVVGISQGQATQEAEKFEKAREKANREAIDKINEGIDADFSTIVEGMSYDEVIEKVGTPYEKHIADVDDAPDFDSEMWYYRGETIVFVDGKVYMTSY